MGQGERGLGSGHWEGTCPECGGLAVFREVATSTVLGACCSPVRCWWSAKEPLFTQTDHLGGDFVAVALTIAGPGDDIPLGKTISKESSVQIVFDTVASDRDPV